MTSRLAETLLDPKALGDYGAARARDLAFDAVIGLWRRRRAAGMKQMDLAERLGRDPGWVSRALRGPGNWTIRTFGELVAAMDGEMEISVFALEDPPSHPSNYDAYAEFDAATEPSPLLRHSVLDVPFASVKNITADALQHHASSPSNIVSGLPKRSILRTRENAIIEN